MEEFTVNLSSCACSLGNSGTKSLMRSISRHVDPHRTVKTHINMLLERSEIYEEDASHIAELLNNTSIVHTLTMNCNPLGDKGLQSISKSLKKNTSLTVLSVGKCNISDTGVASLAEALKVNTTLKRLNIDDNDAITDSGLRCLAGVLSRNSDLEELDIPRHLRVDIARDIINCERQRCGLTYIQVNGQYKEYIRNLGCATRTVV